jgi:S1-C subfamily serine protease
MLRITHTRGRMAPAIEHFAAARVRIGSAPDSEVRFDVRDGGSVAPLHAEIRFEGGAWHLVDLGAPAGTLVNRARVSRRPLASGDVVAVGGAGGPEFRVDVLGGFGGAEAPRVPVSMGPQAAPNPGPASRAPAGAGANLDPERGGVDLETARRMVADAMARAAAGTGDDKTAAIVAAKVAAAQRHASRNNALLTLGLGATFVALLITGAVVWESQRRAGVLTSEAGFDRGGGTKPQGEIPAHVYTGREIYDQNRGAVYLIGWLSGNKVGGVCTGFAIRPHVLATNAHCIAAYKEKGGTAVVTQNDSGGKVRYHILAAQVHPGYKARRSSADAPDVGLIRVDGTMPKTVTLANDAELHALGPGDDMYVLGFPGRLMDPISPSATFVQGHLGRVMALGEREPESPDDAVLVQHDAVTRGGNSGSPIFNQYGHVIAIHAAHLDDEDEVQVGGQKTTVVNASPFRVGMRIDLLRGVGAP